MLHADKQALERRLALDMLSLRQKELAHLTRCCFTLAQPASLFAGFAYIAMSQVQVPEGTPWWLHTLFFWLSMLAMVFEIAATIRASLVGLLGPALALRGRPGSMHRAVETMGPCFMGAWFCFVAGVVFISLSTIVNLFLQPRFLGNSVLAASLVVVGMWLIYRDMGYLHAEFNLHPEDIVGARFSKAEVSSMVRQGAAPSAPPPLAAAWPPPTHHSLRSPTAGAERRPGARPGQRTHSASLLRESIGGGAHSDESLGSDDDYASSDGGSSRADRQRTVR